MAKSKDRTLNPAAAQLKLDKQKALKKGKAAVLAQRTTRLAARNPNRLERQIEDLKALPAPNARDKKNLEDAEKELARVRRAKEKVGDGGGGGQNNRDHDRKPGERGSVLGKRPRDGQDERRQRGVGTRDYSRAGGRGGRLGEEADSDGGEETDASVRAIPMPRDTPPPIPHQNRPRPQNQHAPNSRNQTRTTTTSNLTNANLEPVSSARGLDNRSGGGGGGESTASPVAVVGTLTATTAKAAPRTVYEAKPMVRDLRKEAVDKFLPEAVRRKQVVMGSGAGAGGGERGDPEAGKGLAVTRRTETEPESEEEDEEEEEEYPKAEAEGGEEDISPVLSPPIPHPHPHPHLDSPPPLHHPTTAPTTIQSQPQPQPSLTPHPSHPSPPPLSNLNQIPHLPTSLPSQPPQPPPLVLYDDDDDDEDEEEEEEGGGGEEEKKEGEEEEEAKKRVTSRMKVQIEDVDEDDEEV